MIAALRERMAAAVAVALYALANRLNREENLGPIWRPGSK